MPSELLLLGVADRIATVTINRPDKLNALNEQVIRELGETFAELATRDDVGAIILTGAGRAFAAGADIAALATATAPELQCVSKYGGDIFRTFETSRKPVIAAVNGFAFGDAESVGFGRVDRIAGEEHLEGRAASNQARQSLRAAVARNEAELYFGKSEDRLIGGDANVT
jgi:enoyl-CoA hydratase